MTAAAVVGCNGAQGPGPDSNTPPPTPTVEVSGAAALPSSTTSDDEVDPSGHQGGALEARLVRLRGRQPWRELKELWRELDGVMPPQQPTMQPYGGALASAQAEALATRAERLVQSLERESLVTAPEAAFFREIIGLRLQNMDHGFMRLMVMHRMPPPFLSAKVATVNRLEQQIDALIELRQKKGMAPEPLALALDRVQQEGVTLYVLDTLSRELGLTYRPPIAPADGETMLAELARKVAEARSDGGLGDERSARVLQEARALVPVIRALMAELER